MSSFAEFKKETGYSSEELEKITGYTRQGLHYAFSKIDQGQEPSKKFLVCIDKVVSQKVEEETQHFTQRIDSLKGMQERFNNLREEYHERIKI